MSNKTSCIEHPARAALVIVREDYLAIVDGEHCGAALLNYLEHWTNSKLDELEQHTEAAAQGVELPAPEIWIYASTDKIVFDLFGIYKRDKVSSELDRLFEIGFIDRRHNPARGYDRTYQYKLNVAYVQIALSEIRQSIIEKSTMEKRKTDNALSKNRQAIPESPSKTPSKDQKKLTTSPSGDSGSLTVSSNGVGKLPLAEPITGKTAPDDGDAPKPPSPPVPPPPASPKPEAHERRPIFDAVAVWSWGIKDTSVLRKPAHETPTEKKNRERTASRIGEAASFICSRCGVKDTPETAEPALAKFRLFAKWYQTKGYVGCAPPKNDKFPECWLRWEQSSLPDTNAAADKWKAANTTSLSERANRKETS